MFFKRQKFQNTNEMLIKSSAYDALAEQKVSTLPVPTPQTETIIVFPMQCLKEPPLYCDIYQYDGVLMRVGSDNDKHYVLMFNLDASRPRQKWAIYQLLYYIKAGIADEHPKEYIRNELMPEAEIFASHFACPDIVLESCNIKQTETIMKYCDIPFDAAHRKYKYLKNGHKKFTFNSLEKMVENNFKQFIDSFPDKER